MDKGNLGDLEGKPYFEYLPQELRDALDAKCKGMGITPVAFIGVVAERGLFFAPMASMSDAQAKSLTEKVLPVVVDALRESDHDARPKRGVN